MMKLRLYQRYLLRETLAASFLVLGAFLALFSFFDLINELRSIGKGSYEFGHALVFVVLSLPARVYELLPIAALIGTLYALSTLARHSEINVLRTAGLSTRDLLLTLFRAAALLAVLAFVVGEAVVPYSERMAQNLRTRALSKMVAQPGFTTGLWLKDGMNFVNVRSATPDAKLLGIRIYSFDKDGELVSVSEAKEGIFLPPNRWQLSDVVSTVLQGERARVEQHARWEWKSALNPDLLSVLMISPDRMSLYGLLNYTSHLIENRLKTERYEIAIWKKLLYPLAAFVMVALALPFGYTHDRVGGVSLKIFSGVMIGIFFHMLNGLFSSLGVINAWPPLASAIAPSLLFMVAAFAMLWWAERR